MGCLIDHTILYAFQLETAPTTGYLHWQGYFELINKKRLTAIKSKIYPFEFLAKRKGTPLQAFTYATKDETRVLGPWTLGTPTSNASGAQMNNERYIADILAGFSDVELARAHPSSFVRHAQVIDRLRQHLEPPPHKPEVYLFFGRPGCGKTVFAKEQARLLQMTAYRPPLGKDFWQTPDLYKSDYVLLDDFKANLALADLLQLLDQDAVKVPVKGSFIWWRPKFIVITTNVTPHDWYQFKDRSFEKEALFRRFTGCYLFEKNLDCIPRPIAIDIHDPNAFGVPPRRQELDDFQLLVRKYKTAKMNDFFINTYRCTG